MGLCYGPVKHPASLRTALAHALGMDLSALTDAQLQTLLTNLLAAHAKACTAQSYSIEGLGVSNMSAAEIMAQIAAVSAEISARTDETGGVVLVQFEEPGDRT